VVRMNGVCSMVGDVIGWGMGTKGMRWEVGLPSHTLEVVYLPRGLNELSLVKRRLSNLLTWYASFSLALYWIFL